METTRHFTATVYVVNGEETLLHEHKRLALWLPPGGHIDRDELPHETARRETLEETGLEIELLQEAEGPSSSTARPLPHPASLQLADVNAHQGEVGHQHIDFIYFAVSDRRTVRPLSGEVGADAWEWVTREQLATEDRFDDDIAELGTEAIEAALEFTSSHG